MNGPKNNYMTRLLNSRKIGTWVHGRAHMTTYRGVRLSSSKEVIQGKSGTHEIARNQGSFRNKRKRKLHGPDYKKILQMKEEPALALVEPNFRTPPFQLMIGRILMNIC